MSVLNRVVSLFVLCSLAPALFAQAWDETTNASHVTTTRHVGIGVTPADRLSIYGGINLGSNFGGVYNGLWLNGGTERSNYNILSSTGDRALYVNRPTGYGIFFREDNGSIAQLTVASGGHIGIGTNAPAARLHMVGLEGHSIYAVIERSSTGPDGALIFRNGGGAGASDWLVGKAGGASSNDLVFAYPSMAAPRFVLKETTGWAGFGTTAPNAVVHVASTSQSAPRLLLGGAEYYQGAGSAGTGVAMVLGVNRPDNKQLWLVDSEQLGAPTPPSALRVLLGGSVVTLDAIDTAAAPRTLRVGNTAGVLLSPDGGTVAVGTHAPNTGVRLHVNGNARFDGTVTGTNIQAHYQDVAEWVPSTEEMEPGTVVVLSTRNSNEVTPSSEPYDTRVAGVVSAQPGLILGVGGSGKEQIATTGRVKVRVDATRAPIAIGDLLVTSGSSGMAMKSEPMQIGGRSFHQPGTIVGKALEPLRAGTGEILVLLSLQ